MSLGGLFLETHRSSGVGSTAKLEFLVQEDRSGPTPLCGVSSQGRGLALKFTAVMKKTPRLEALMRRLRSWP